MSDFTNKYTQDEFIKKAEDNGWITDFEERSKYLALYRDAMMNKNLDKLLNQVMEKEVWYEAERKKQIKDFDSFVYKAFDDEKISQATFEKIAAHNKYPVQKKLDEIYKKRFNKDRPLTAAELEAQKERTAFIDKLIANGWDNSDPNSIGNIYDAIEKLSTRRRKSIDDAVNKLLDTKLDPAYPIKSRNDLLRAFKAEANDKLDFESLNVVSPCDKILKASKEKEMPEIYAERMANSKKYRDEFVSKMYAKGWSKEDEGLMDAIHNASNSYKSGESAPIDYDIRRLLDYKIDPKRPAGSRNEMLRTFEKGVKIRKFNEEAKASLLTAVKEAIERGKEAEQKEIAKAQKAEFNRLKNEMKLEEVGKAKPAKRDAEDVLKSSSKDKGKVKIDIAAYGNDPQAKLKLETYNKIEAMIKEKKYEEFGKAFLSSYNENSMHQTEETIAVNSVYCDYIRGLATPVEGTQRLSDANLKLFKNLYLATNHVLNDSALKVGKQYENWKTKIANGDIKDTELYIDDPKFVSRLAHDLATLQGPDGLFSGDAVSAISLFGMYAKDNGVKIDELDDPADSVRRWGYLQSEDYCKEKGVDQKKFKEYIEVINDFNDNTSKTGFKVKVSEVINENDPFEKIPSELTELRGLKTEGQVKKYVDKIKNRLETKRDYTNEVLDMAEKAKELLHRLEETEMGDKKPEEYKKLYASLENFTKLGVAFFNAERHDPGTEKKYKADISMPDMDFAFSDLSETSINLVDKYNNLSRTERSNAGYGDKMADIATEIYKFSNANEEILSRYERDSGSLETNVKEAEKQVNFLNKYLRSEGRPIVSDDFINEYREEGLERQNAIVVDDAPAAKNKSYDEYIRLHTTHGGLKPKTKAEKVQALAKVLAAYSLKNNKRSKDKFDVKQIRKWADEITKIYCLDSLNSKQLDEAIKDRNSALKMGEKQRRETYDIKDDRYNEFISEMATLAAVIPNEKKHGDRYKAFAKAVRAAAQLDEKTAGMTPEKKAEVFGQVANDIVLAVSNYINGREKPRSGEEDKRTFNSNLDALAIVSKYTKKQGMTMNQRVNDLIDQINSKRNADDKIKKNDFEKNYGKNRIHAEVVKNHEAAAAMRK